MQEDGMVDLLVPMQESLSLYVYKYIYLFIYLLYLFARTSQRKSTITGKASLCNNCWEILVVKNY